MIWDLNREPARSQASMLLFGHADSLMYSYFSLLLVLKLKNLFTSEENKIDKIGPLLWNNIVKLLLEINKCSGFHQTEEAYF
jgi:hypothetical protein